MKHVMVIMSTYNGACYIERQLDSIINQKDVKVSVFIRDDNSQDNTIEVIKEYITRKKIDNIKFISGKNVGYARSFWEALRLCEEADYYAFSDQDDIWNIDKLLICINEIDNDINIPQLSYCRMRRCDENLNVLSEQVNILKDKDLTKKMVLTQTYNYGAATVINHSARELILRCCPTSPLMPHDTWAGILCFWFGEVKFVDEFLYDWIRYDSSVTGAGTKWSGKIYRIKAFFHGKSYPNVSTDLLEFYSDLLEEKDVEFLTMLRDYKKKLKYKLMILFDKEFRRANWQGTIMLKLGVLLNQL